MSVHDNDCWNYFALVEVEGRQMFICEDYANYWKEVIEMLVDEYTHPLDVHLSTPNEFEEHADTEVISEWRLLGDIENIEADHFDQPRQATVLIALNDDNCIVFAFANTTRPPEPPPEEEEEELPPLPPPEDTLHDSFSHLTVS